MNAGPAENPTNPSAGDLAASALIGALLWDPARTSEVSEWLEPDDFAHWAHRAIYQTLTGLLADGQPVDLLSLPEVLASGRYHDVPIARGSNGPLAAPALHSLLAATPATPRADDLARHGVPTARSEHVRYGRIVLEESIRRQVAAAGTRINQQAREASGRDADTAAELVAPLMTETLARLDELGARLGNAGGAGRIAAALNPRSPERLRETISPSIGGGKVRPPLSTATVAQAERTLIGSCLVSDELRQHVAGRLLPEDFTTPAAVETWVAITALMQRGEPVDFVLVAVEVERRGAGSEAQAAYTPADLARLASRGDAPSGYRAADTVVRAALARAAENARNELAELAADRAQAGPNLIHNARAAVGGVQATARRLGGHAATTAAAAFLPPARRSGDLQPPRQSGQQAGAPIPAPEPANARQQNPRRR